MSLIVILDDRATNRQIFSRLAASIEDGVTVRAFADPLAALVWLETNTPDLVVTDFKMPNLDGAEFTRRFRAQPNLSEVPVIVITVYEEREFRLRALEAGATDFLSSPVDHHEFQTRARNLLKLRKQQLLLARRANNLEQKLEYSERSREEALRDSSERLAQVIDTVPAMISASDRDGKFLFVNAFQTALAGIDHAAALGKDIGMLFGEEHGSRSRALDRKVFGSGAALPTYEEEIVDATGVKRVFLTTKSPLRDRANAVIAVLTSSIDITDRKRAEDHLLHIAHHDALTGLPNRALLADRLRREIARARRGDRPFALHLIDLDGFKNINDVLGHVLGDKFLKVVAQRLRSLVREGDTVARLGGDEFAVLQSRLTRSEEAAELAARIVAAVSEPYQFAGERITTNASVGTTLHPADGADAEALLKHADLAMYRAKADGGNVVRFYAADMHSRAQEARHLDSELRQAIQDNQFVLYYQPQVDLKTGHIIGAEALLRWRRPGRGIVGPGVFLARAEENGLIVPINEWVLRQACRDAKSWQRAGFPPLRVGVNLSAVQFRKQSVPLLVAKTLADTGLDPRRLDLELTESIVMADTEAVAADLHRLHELGVSISIDDFGTGYSSLTYVKNFPVDRLKIDQCFIRDLATDPSDAAIVRAIVSLGHSLELAIVAEGVETADQLERLRAEDCDEVQGYYFGRPLPVGEFLALAFEAPPLVRSA
jgi:diguanylate cyclase (GGDEF)-like protein/PAS domain S-box-containing protein